MEKALRFKIISEAKNNGVKATCEKYNISRTIYYRWLNRYKNLGLDGLNDVKKDFTPTNKTSPEIEKAIIELVKIYPTYGPKALNYLLEELGHNISSSAVFNVLSRYHLTNKNNRVKFSKIRGKKITRNIPLISDPKSGESWIFWITDIGSYENNKNIYAYTFFDIQSRIACTRLYKEITLDNFEDILTAVALSVATTLNFKISNLNLFSDCQILCQYKNSFKSRINNILTKHGRDIKVNILDVRDDFSKLYELKVEYTKIIIKNLISLLSTNNTFTDIKFKFQDFVRNYNLNEIIKYDDMECSPLDYHHKITKNKLILPLWAYIDREY